MTPKRLRQLAASFTTTAPNASPWLQVNARFMQNYVQQMPVTGYGEMAATTNGAGEIELFTIGSNGDVYNIYPDTASESGWSAVNMGFNATSLAAGRTPDGSMIVLGGDAQSLNYVVETPGGPSKWGPLEALSTQIGVSCRPVVMNAGNALYIGALSFAGADHDLTVFQISLMEWGTGAATLPPPTAVWRKPSTTAACAQWYFDTGSNTPSFWVFANDGSAQGYTFINGVLAPAPRQVSISAYGDASTHGWSVATLPPAWVSVVDINGTQALFYLSTGGILKYDSPDSTTTVGFVLGAHGIQDIPIQRFAAGVSNGTTLQVVMLATDNTIYYSSTLTTAVSWGQIIDLGLPATQLCYATDADGNAQVLSIATQTNALMQTVWDSSTQDWTTEPIEVQSSALPVPIISYTTEIKVLDSTGQPAAGATVKIWSSDLMQATANGVTSFVDAVRPIVTTSNGGALVSISSATSSLATATLQVWTDLMPDGATVVIEPNADVQGELATVTGGDLLDATDAEGEKILPPSYQNEATATQIAGIVTQCMSLTTVSSGSGDQGVRTARFQASSSRLAPKRLPGGMPAQYWHAEVGNGAARLEHLTRSDALARIAAHAGQLGAGGFLGVDWGGLWQAVRDGAGEIANALSVVVAAVGDTVQVAISAVINGISYAWNGVISLVEQAFDVIEGVFETIGVAFGKLFEWLGFLFDWPDIIRTANGVQWMIGQSLDMMSQFVTYLKAQVDDKIQGWESAIQGYAAQVMQNAVANQSYTTFQGDAPAPGPGMDFATSHNIAFNGFLDNASAGSAPASAVFTRRGAADSGPSPIGDFVNNLLQNLQNIQTGPSSQDFQNAVTLFSNLGQQIQSNPDQILQTAFAAFVNVGAGIANLVLEVVQTVVDTLLDALNAVIQTIEGWMTTEWNIPFVSGLYSMATATSENPNGDPLTAVGLMSLAIAIPTTVMYKVLKGAAPFPQDSDLAAFEAQYTAASILSGMGITNTGGARSARGLALSSDVQMLIAVTGFAGNSVFGITSAVLDGMPLDVNVAPPSPAENFFSIANILSEAVITFTGAPFWSSVTVSSIFFWAPAVLGTVVDSAFFVYFGHVPELNGTGGVVLDFFVGLAAFAAGWAVLIEDAPNPLISLGNIASTIPQMLKLARLDGVARELPFMPGLLALTDLLCCPVASFANLMVVTANQMEGAAGAAPA